MHLWIWFDPNSFIGGDELFHQSYFSSEHFAEGGAKRSGKLMVQQDEDFLSSIKNICGYNETSCIDQLVFYYSLCTLLHGHHLIHQHYNTNSITYLAWFSSVRLKHNINITDTHWILNIQCFAMAENLACCNFFW